MELHATRGPNPIPIGSLVVPFCGLCLESYKLIPQKRTTKEPMGIVEFLNLDDFVSGAPLGAITVPKSVSLIELDDQKSGVGLQFRELGRYCASTSPWRQGSASTSKGPRYPYLGCECSGQQPFNPPP